MDSEQIVLLNDNWQPIGVAPKLASHHADTPLHLAFSCYVFNDEGQVLVTRRALSKKVWPGIWTNSCCGHPAPNEPMEAAIDRRLDYELGMDVIDLQLALPRFRYCCEFGGILENECCPVYVAKVRSQPVPNPEEVEDYVWLSWQDFKTDATQHPNEYSEWCRLQIPLLEAAGFAPLTD
ncbi:MAG: isopentenyl-diphosphate Delta-isomerase [Patescibacteria group bacterium]|nr:isopentenyl-diphosphate Delta-isomerase [Patescibacteria group bacterium]